MPKKETSTPTQDTWSFTIDEVKRMVKEHLGLVDGDIVILGDRGPLSNFTVIHSHQKRMVQELDHPGPHATKGTIDWSGKAEEKKRKERGL